jgi:hypothetical protein
MLFSELINIKAPFVGFSLLMEGSLSKTRGCWLISREDKRWGKKNRNCAMPFLNTRPIQKYGSLPLAGEHKRKSNLSPEIFVQKGSSVKYSCL